MGSLGKDGKWTGLIGDLVADNTSTLTITPERGEVVDYTMRFYSGSTACVIRYPKLDNVFFEGYIKSFYYGVWLLLVITLFTIAIGIYIIAKYSVS